MKSDMESNTPIFIFYIKKLPLWAPTLNSLLKVLLLEMLPLGVMARLEGTSKKSQQ